MLRFMRDSSQSFLIYVMFGVLVFVFAVSFGPGSASCGAPMQDYAVIVNDDIIRRQEYALHLNSQMDRMRRMGAFGESLNSEALRDTISRQVLDQMIEAKLLIQEAERLGLRVTDDELLSYLENNLGLKDLDYKELENYITRAYGMTVAQFEEQTRQDILATRVNRFVREMIAVGDEELKQKFLREHDRAKVALVRFSPQQVTAEEAEEITAEAVEEVLQKEPEAVRKAYDDNIFKYRTSQEVRARQILKKLPRDASEEQVAKAQNELAELRAKLEGGANFAELAAAHSEDEATKDKGGDLGFVKQGLMARSLVDAIFDLEKDALTQQPVRTPQGLHLLQVTEIKPPSNQEFEEVKQDAARTLLQDRQKQAAARAQAEKLLAQLKEGASLEELTRGTDSEPTDDPSDKPTRVETGWILASEDTIPGVGEAPQLHAAIFEASPEQPVLDKVFEAARGYYVVKLLEREQPDLSKFPEAKEDLRNSTIWGKQNDVYRAWVKHLRSQADIQIHPDIAPSGDPKLPFPSPAG